MPSNKKKKSVKRRDRNEKATSCHGCSRQLDKHDFVYCLCTQVRFCSTSCSCDNPHNNCPGPPKKEFDMAHTLAQIPKEGRRSDDVARRQDAETELTVRKPMMAYVMRKGLNHLRRGMEFSAWDYAQMADEGDEMGNQACAYLAGSQFRHRLLGTPQLQQQRGRGRGENMVGRIREDQNIPVLESQELAFKYFYMAAKLGHGLAMQSLGTCFDDGVGCRANRRRCNQWLWRACLHNSSGSIELLDSRALLPLEVNSNGGSLDQALFYLQPGQQMRAGGPNLASLLLAFSDVIEKENYSLPPFAGTWATGTVNNPTKATTCDQPRTPLIGAKEIKDLMKKKEILSQRHNKITFGYCRRGAAKQATLQTHEAATRAVDNQIFFVPPFAACDERVDDEVVQNWHHQCRQLYYRDHNTTISSVVCIHNEKRERPAPFCSDCEADAIERLDAISKGSVVLSLDQELSQRGQAAIFFDKNGVLKTETWKTYAGGEAECVLAVLAASGLSPYVAPLFIAQDPNFLWPLIADHGSIRAALEFVAPHIDWDERVGSVKENVQEQVPVIPSCKPGKYLRRCGNSFCCNMEGIKDKIFEVCTRCDRRQYCSQQCQLADWSVHKLECGSKTKEKEANPRLDVLAIGLVGQEPKELKHQLKVEEGEDCVVHGLQAKPHYNGIVGIIGHTTDSGRVSVTLRCDAAETVLAVKPTNLYCIGVFCRKRKKKSRVFECAHGLDVCEECYFDFSTINRLAELKYKGQDMTSASAIDQVNTMYFSSLSAFDIEVERSGTFDREWPIECNGMQKHLKQRFILKALLQVKQRMSLHAEAAKTAFMTYGGAFTNPTLRADTTLGDVADML